MKFLNTSIGRLRLVAFLEGLSLLVLVFIAMPFKYLGQDESLVKAIGPVHGVLFVLFVLYALYLGYEKKWKFFKTTWKVLASSIIPFGTFYIDHTILRKMDATD